MVLNCIGIGSEYCFGGWLLMTTELYVDGVGEVVITGTVVRIDLMAFETSDRDQSGRPRAIVRERIVMPVDGFVRGVESLRNTLTRLEEIGVIKKRTDSAGPTEGANVESET